MKTVRFEELEPGVNDCQLKQAAFSYGDRRASYYT